MAHQSSPNSSSQALKRNQPVRTRSGERSRRAGRGAWVLRHTAARTWLPAPCPAWRRARLPRP
eukprot:7380702-Prymnesium_polylepis.1